MHAYIAVRSEGERLVAAKGIPATILRPWYVLGPGHYWPYALVPIYAVLRLLPSKRETAERLGLVNKVVPESSLDVETARIAARLASGPTAVYARTKALLNGSLNASLESQLQREAEAFAQSASEPDFHEGVAAFVEKRKPQFKGR